MVDPSPVLVLGSAVELITQEKIGSLAKHVLNGIELTDSKSSSFHFAAVTLQTPHSLATTAS
jgi:hypothetical protein